MSDVSDPHKTVALHVHLGDIVDAADILIVRDERQSARPARGARKTKAAGDDRPQPIGSDDKVCIDSRGPSTIGKKVRPADDVAVHAKSGRANALVNADAGGPRAIEQHL